MKDAIIFSCFTPYQLITAIYYSMNLSQSNGMKKILIWDNRTEFEILPKTVFSCFDDVIEISQYNLNEFTEKNMFRRTYCNLVYKGVLFPFSLVAKRIKHYDRKILAVFTDQDYVTNRLIEYVAGGRNNRIILIEEGLNTYLLNEKYVEPVAKKIYHLLLGMDKQDYIGGNKKIDSVIVRYPERLPAVKSQGRIVVEQNNMFLDKKWMSTFGKLIQQEFAKVKNIVGDKVVLWLDQPLEEIGVEVSDEIALLLQMADIVDDETLILIKRHPRSPTAKYSALSSKKISVLELGDLSWIPIEFFAHAIHPKVIISAFSTGAMNLREIGVDAEVFYCYKCLNINVDSNFFDKVQDEHIHVINSVSEITFERCDDKLNLQQNKNLDIDFISTALNY